MQKNISTHSYMLHAFKWAVANTFSEQTRFLVSIDEIAQNSQNLFNLATTDEQKKLNLLALHACKNLLAKEALFFKTNTGQIRFNNTSSEKNIKGCDLIFSTEVGEIWVSCKQQLTEIKEVYFSSTTDFIKEWHLDELGCSQSYWSETKPLFAKIKNILSAYKPFEWSSYSEKDTLFLGVLEAWEKELLRCYGVVEGGNSPFCKNLISYIFGTQPHYKLILHDTINVTIQCVSFQKHIANRTAKYPTVIRTIDSLDDLPYSKTIAFNNGFSINFRIHSADSKLNTSLKFAISAISLPVGQFYQQTLEV